MLLLWYSLEYTKYTYYIELIHYYNFSAAAMLDIIINYYTFDVMTKKYINIAYLTNIIFFINVNDDAGLFLV
jgi:hypothetical protein